MTSNFKSVQIQSYNSVECVQLLCFSLIILHSTFITMQLIKTVVAVANGN